jgi:uncharacterized membrane protein YbjE (DUF340 family)
MMLSSKDYSKMTLEELVSEEKKMKSQKIAISVLAGFIIGVAVYAATHHKGFVLTVVLLILPLQIGKKHSQNLKRIQAEISSRDAGKISTP